MTEYAIARCKCAALVWSDGDITLGFGDEHLNKKRCPDNNGKHEFETLETRKLTRQERNIRYEMWKEKYYQNEQNEQKQQDGTAEKNRVKEEKEEAKYDAPLNKPSEAIARCKCGAIAWSDGDTTPGWGQEHLNNCPKTNGKHQFETVVIRKLTREEFDIRYQMWKDYQKLQNEQKQQDAQNKQYTCSKSYAPANVNTDNIVKQKKTMKEEKHEAKYDQSLKKPNNDNEYKFFGLTQRKNGKRIRIDT